MGKGAVRLPKILVLTLPHSRSQVGNGEEGNALCVPDGARDGRRRQGSKVVSTLSSSTLGSIKGASPVAPGCCSWSISTRILGRRTAPFPLCLTLNRVPHGATPRS